MNPNKNENKEDNTNWRAWYIALVAVLLAQLIAFSVITKFYAQ